MTGKTHQVDDLLEPDLDFTVPEVGEGLRIVDELSELSLAHLGRPVAEDEEEGVDRIGLAGTVWADDGRKGLETALWKEKPGDNNPWSDDVTQVRGDSCIKRCTLWKGPISCLPAYDLKFSSTILWMIRRFWGPSILGFWSDWGEDGGCAGSEEGRDAGAGEGG